MRKYIGIMSWGILTAGIAALFSLLYLVGGYGLISGVWWVYLFYFLIFFKVIVITPDKVRVFRPLWFLKRNNSIRIVDITKIFVNIRSSVGGSVSILFYNKEDIGVVDCWCQFYKFEIKRMTKIITEYNENIEIVFGGTGTIDW